MNVNGFSSHFVCSLILLQSGFRIANRQILSIFDRFICL